MPGLNIPTRPPSGTGNDFDLMLTGSSKLIVLFLLVATGLNHRGGGGGLYLLLIEFSRVFFAFITFENIILAEFLKK